MPANASKKDIYKSRMMATFTATIGDNWPEAMTSVFEGIPMMVTMDAGGNSLPKDILAAGRR